jgi:hypothetical protein
MWKTNANGKPMTHDGDFDRVPFKPLWGNVSINPMKANQEAQLIKASKSLKKYNFIKLGIV